MSNRHKYGKTLLAPEDAQMPFGRTTRKVCVKCGLRVTTWYAKKGEIPFMSYDRSGIIFHDGMPECIDWEAEKKNTFVD